MKAVLTRTGDYFVPFKERIRRARDNEADLFVSIHADAFMDRSVRGSSVYVLSTRRASSEAARWLGAASLLLVFPYPLMKRITWWPQLFLGFIVAIC